MFIDRLQFLHLLDQAVQVVRHYDLFRPQDLRTQQHSITSQGARPFSSTTIRTSNVRAHAVLRMQLLILRKTMTNFSQNSKISGLIHTLDHITWHHIPGQDMTHFKELCQSEWRDWEHPRNNLRQSNCVCQARSGLKTS